MKLLRYFLLLLCCCSIPVKAETLPYKVNQNYAMRLAIEAAWGADMDAVENETISFSPVGEDIGDATKPFYVFRSFSDSGLYGVNPWTGDVWDLWSCKKLDTRVAKKDRSRIRQTFTPEEMKQYKKLAALKPQCWS